MHLNTAKNRLARFLFNNLCTNKITFVAAILLCRQCAYMKIIEAGWKRQNFIKHGI